MKSTNEQWAVPTVVRKEKNINPKPQYQRGPVWSESQKQLLIDSILRGMDIPKFYLREIETERYSYEIVDGQQRLRTIWEFWRNEFTLPLDADPVDGKKIAGKTYDELPEELKNELDTCQISIVLLEAEEEEDIEEMFLRLQNGTTLKAAERRNAIHGPVRDFVRKQVTHDFWKVVAFKNNRFAYDAVTAQMLLLELLSGPADIKDKDLEKMYKERTSFSASCNEAKHFKKTLNFLAKEFKESCPYLKRQTVVSVYLLASELLRHYSISKYNTGWFRKWFEGFEDYKSKELNKTEETIDSEIDRYFINTQQGTNRKDSVRIRNEVLQTHLLSNHPDLEIKDPKRCFSESQRLAIFRRDGGVCQQCAVKLIWEDVSADHVKAYTKGGSTVVGNAQLLCSKCNSSKQDK